VPLGELYSEPAPRFLAERGGEVRLRSRVERVRLREDGAADGVVLADGTEEAADYVVAIGDCATPSMVG
jgi:phytoene dehydrogenase-like protein